MVLYEKLRRLLAEKGWPQAELARKASVCPSNLSNIFHRANNPQLSTALRIARALDVPLEWLADDAQEWPPPKPGCPVDQLKNLLQLAFRDIMPVATATIVTLISRIMFEVDEHREWPRDGSKVRCRKASDQAASPGR